MTLLILANLFLSNQVFNQITQVIHIENDVYMISTSGGSHHAHVYNALDDSIVYSFIRNGSGPGEARGVVAMADCGDGTFVFYSSDGRVLHYNSDYTLIGELLIIQSSVNSLYCNSNVISIGLTGFFRTEQLHSHENYLIGISYDMLTRKKISSTYLKGTDIYLGADGTFKNTPFLMIEFFLARIDDDRYVISINGSPVIYLINNEVRTITYQHEYLRETGFKEVEHPAYGFGQKTSGVNRNWQIHSHPEKKEFHFSFGQITDHLALGFVKLITYNDFNITLNYILFEDSFQKSLSELDNNYTVTTGKTTRILFGSMSQQANYLYVYN